MQKNWYIIYTKEAQERKVAIHLNRKKIETFVPMCARQITSLGRHKHLLVPLFRSYVFAYAEQDTIEKAKAIRGVINFVFWKDKPAIIREEEIETLKDFLGTYTDIYTERIQVNNNNNNNIPRTIDSSLYSIHGKLLFFRNTEAKILLPCIGFSVVAKRGIENPLSVENYWGNSLLESEKNSRQTN